MIGNWIQIQLMRNNTYFPNQILYFEHYNAPNTLCLGWYTFFEYHSKLLCYIAPLSDVIYYVKPQEKIHIEIWGEASCGGYPESNPTNKLDNEIRAQEKYSTK